MPRYKYVVVACARWETPYIREWLGYYEAIGFDHVYLYCNDDDPTDFFREAVAHSPAKDFVTLLHFPGQGLQWAMYRHALASIAGEAEWVSFIDIDEFLALRGTDDIHRFMSRFGNDVDCVYFNWLMFGNNGFAERPCGSVLRHYTRRSATVDHHTKHISRVAQLTPERLDVTRFPFWHGLQNPVWSGMRRVNVLGEDWGRYFDEFPRSSERALAETDIVDRLISTATVNHYVFKSELDFLLRAQRGLGGQFGGQVRWAELYQSGEHKRVLADLDQTEDRYLQGFAASRELLSPQGSHLETVR